MKIFVPESLINMNNTVLYVELETYPENNHGMTFGKEIIKQRMFTRNISNPVGSYSFNYQANYSPDDLKNFTLVEMPGFQLKWSYNIDLDPESKYSKDGWTLEFVRYFWNFSKNNSRNFL